MVKYFVELDDPKNYYLDLIDTRLKYNKDIDIDNLPLSFFEKYKNLFQTIDNLNLLHKLNNGQKELYLNNDIENFEFSFEESADFFIKYGSLKSLGLSDYGIEKMKFLCFDFFNKYNMTKSKEEFADYFVAIIKQFMYSDNLIRASKNYISNYLLSARQMIISQNKMNDKLELLFDEALKYIRNYKVEIPKRNFEPVKVTLPNAWYITPYNHLYNTMGPNGHKEANLIYPLYYRIYCGMIENPYLYLKNAKSILNEGWIDSIDFSHYTNLIYDYVSIFPEFYYQFNMYQRLAYKNIYAKTYNLKIVKLIAGIVSAHAGLYSFFNNLKENSLDYDRDLEYTKQFSLDEILVRCCGFHKISSVLDKTITTSCINYENEFEEYIKRGWTIDFVKPIILNEYTKKLEEYSDDFILIKKMHSITK